MVITKTIRRVQKELEKFLIGQNGYSLDGTNFDLMLLKPIENFYPEKYSWIISAQILDRLSKKDTVISILNQLKSNLEVNQYQAVSSLNLVKSSETLVENLKPVLNAQYWEEYREISGVWIGDQDLDNALLIKPQVLENLVAGDAVIVKLQDGREISAGIINIDKDFQVKYYTGYALKNYEIDNLEGMSEDNLIKNGLVGFLEYEFIEAVYNG